MKRKLLYLILLAITPIIAQNQKQSIGFKENIGQIVDQKNNSNTAVKFLLNTGGLNVQLKKNGFSYDIYEAKKIPCKTPLRKKAPDTHSPKEVTAEPDYNLEYKFHRIDIDFVGSNSKVELIAEQKSKDFDNYYNIPNKPEGIVGVHQYKQVTYKNIYPNIDVVFTIPNDPKKVVEYNFVVHPKGKISDIQLKFNGAETNLADNKIQMNVHFGKMEETLPASWTEEGTSKKEIDISYTKIKKNVYGFTTSDDISDKKLIIDPVPVRLWGTFYGDQRNDFTAIGQVSTVTDISGNVYLSGTTHASNSSYATSGAHQTSIPPFIYGSRNGIIVKFTPDGNRLWATYYGGIKDNSIQDIKTDSQNNIIIVGGTKSETNISTSGSYQPNITGVGDTYDAFLVKFNNSGIRIWGTYFGGEDDDSALAVDIDQHDNIYITGFTSSDTNIAKNSNFQTKLNLDNNDGYDDGFLTKFDINGNLLWSTYVGGESHDQLTSIKVKNDYIITGGTSWSYNGITTPGSFQETHNPNPFDALLLKFSVDGQRLWATYYGGEQIDEIYSIDVDDEDNIYIGGQTESDSKMTTPDSFENLSQYTFGKGFLAKLNSDGQRIWGSYLGTAFVHSIVFKNNSIYIGATTHGNPYNTKLTNSCSYIENANSNALISKLSKEGDYIWGTFIGNGYGIHSDTKIALDNNNDIFVSGTAVQNDGIADNLSYQPNILGYTNYFLIKFQESIINGIPDISSNSPICIGNTLELKASGGTTYAWTGPNGFTSSDQNPTIPNATAINSGKYSCLITGTGGCDDTKKIDVVIGDVEDPIPDLANLPTVAGDCNTVITIVPTATDVCAGVIIGTTTNPLSYSLPGTYTIVWNYDDGNGNTSTQNQTVNISNQPLPIVNTNPQSFCIQQNATLTDLAITGQNIKWYDELTAGTLLTNTTLLENGKIYYASQTINGCESERVGITVEVHNIPKPTGAANQIFCTGQNPTIANINITGTTIKWYDAITNGSLLPTTTNLEDSKTYYSTQTLNNCESERFAVTATVQNTPIPPTGDSNQSFCKIENASINNLTVTGQNLKWYDSDLSITPLTNATLLENNTTYFASQTVGCESGRFPVLVTIYDTPLPTGNSNQFFCLDQNATINDIIINGAVLKWYDASVNGNVLQSTTMLQDGSKYYVSQTLNNCESPRLAITIKIQDTKMPIGENSQKFCLQENAAISDINITGQNIKWYNALTGGESLSNMTPLENGKTYYASQTINSCESDRNTFSIQILGSTTADCINFEDELPYPKFFTPNNDGYHDTWTIDFAYLAPNTGIRIFDRYGKFIKELSIDTAWDGTYIGRDEPSSDYWFIVTRLNGAEFRAHFSLKR